MGGLLTRNANERIGGDSSEAAFRHVKGHAFFADINWVHLQEGTAVSPFMPKREVNAKPERDLKTFDTSGMRELDAEDQSRWADWDFSVPVHYQTEVARYLNEMWAAEESKREGRGKRGTGCCIIV